MLEFKSCPRCHGDVHYNSDWYGEYLTCLQCGWSKDSTADPISRLVKARESFVGTIEARKAS